MNGGFASSANGSDTASGGTTTVSASNFQTSSIGPASISLAVSTSSAAASSSTTTNEANGESYFIVRFHVTSGGLYDVDGFTGYSVANSGAVVQFRQYAGVSLYSSVGTTIFLKQNYEYNDTGGPISYGSIPLQISLLAGSYELWAQTFSYSRLNGETSSSSGTADARISLTEHVAAVPEPSTFASSVIAGLMGIGLAWRHRLKFSSLER
ncbi:MAG: PEP-CTERM sorting domain-containing protein [Isosphaeraceae bacterium]